MLKEVLPKYATDESVLGFDKVVREIHGLNQIFSSELTKGLSMQYLGSLLRRLGRADQPWETFVTKGEVLHQYVGEKLYGPLIVGYINWVERKCKEIGYQGSVYFALRDATPLMVAATVLWEGENLKPVGIYANRPILGIADEMVTGQIQNAQAGLKYLEGKGLYQKSEVVWADSGAWGTVVKLMKQTILTDTKVYPFFWYSHNPHIPGYLNSLMVEAELSEKMLETINDSLECTFPQPYQRPTQVEKDGNGWDVVLVPSTELAIVWGKAALEGVTMAAQHLKGNFSHFKEIAQLKMLARLSISTRVTNEWTGVLPHNTPTWSKGTQFLADWPVNLLP